MAIYSARFKPLKGMRFSMLTVEEDRMENNVHVCDCVCDCGGHKTVRAHNLLQGGTKSCGCKNNRFGHARMTEEEKRFLAIWQRSKQDMCKRWQNFQLFKEDMYQSYMEHMPAYGSKYAVLVSDGKIMNQTNSKWKASYELEDRRNILFEGEIHCVSEWAKIKGISSTTLHARLRKGIPFEEAIQKPAKRARQKRIDSSMLIGKTFGRLTVTSVSGKYASCQCACGETTQVLVSSLIHNNTKSCGCLRRRVRL